MNNLEFIIGKLMALMTQMENQLSIENIYNMADNYIITIH